MVSPSESSLPMFQDHLDPQIDCLFGPLCSALPEDEIPQLRQTIDQHLHEIVHALGSNEFLDVVTAQRVTKVLGTLLDDYPSYPESHRALIVGAVRYFIKADDAEPDTSSLLGLDDDVTVLNYVVDQLGAGELKIEL